MLTRTSTDHRRKARVFGRLILTTTRQALSAPAIDGGLTTDAEGRTYGSVVLARRDGRAFVIGWRGARTPHPHRWYWIPAGLIRMRGW